MSEIQEHYSLAKHNEEVSDFVKDRFSDWFITIRYYAAIHWVNGFLIKRFPRQYSPSGHVSRDAFLKTHNRELYAPIRQLEAESESVRYKPPSWKNCSSEIDKLEKAYQSVKQIANS